MPAKSAKQQRFMGACAHGAGYSSCPSQKVAEEFSHKPKGGYKKKKKKHASHEYKKMTKFLYG